MNLYQLIRINFSPQKPLYHSLRNIFGYFPKNISLYELALCHKSVAKKMPNGICISNERLEYLGDAVLGVIVADFLFKKYPYKDEGFLTGMRSKIVSRTQLNILAQRLGVDKLIHSSENSKNLSKSIYGNALEALIGAMYLDKGYRFTKKITLDHLINLHLDLEEVEIQISNYKSKLIEWGQKEKKPVEFKVAGEIGKGYNKQYQVNLFINNELVEKGQDYSIKAAENSASEKAYHKILHAN